MHRFFSEIRDGASAYGGALALVRQYRLWFYLLIPGLISLLFGILIFYGAFALSGSLTEWAAGIYPWETGARLFARITGILGGLLLLAGAFFLYKYVVLILVSPFMSPLSEKVERILRGTSTHTRRPNFLRDLIRGVRVSLRNLIRELFLTLLLFVVTALLPFLSIVSAPILFLLQAYYAGFGNMDFTLERHFGVRGSVRFVRDHRGLATGNGIVFIVLLMIPVVGLFLAPGLSTIAACIRTTERLA